jgi:membrane fusion protein, multidrug efflux system
MGSATSWICEGKKVVDTLTEQEQENRSIGEPATLRQQPVALTPEESAPGVPPVPVDSPPVVSPRPTGTGRRRIWLFILALLVLLIALAIFRGIHHRQDSSNQRFRGPGASGTAANDDNEPVAVGVARASLGDIVVRLPALGTVTPLATVTVKTQISGYLQKIGFKEGQIVRAGEFLAQIDPRPYQAVVDQDKGNLARDEATLADDRLDLTRYQDLIKQDAVSQQQLDQQKFLVDQFIGTVASDKASLEAAQVNLDYTHIVAPIPGRVGLRQVDAGNYVTPGDANGIVVIAQLQPITVIFPVAEDYVPEIQKRLDSGATLQVEAYDRSNSKQLAVGKLLTLDNEIDTTTGTVKLRAVFDNKDNGLFPNQFVNVQLVEQVLEQQLVIPGAAVRRGAPNGALSTFVYIVHPNSTVSVRPIQLGQVDGNNVAVTSGLSSGETVVTDGGDRLRDGAPVLLPGASLPSVPAAARKGKWGRKVAPRSST